MNQSLYEVADDRWVERRLEKRSSLKKWKEKNMEYLLNVLPTVNSFFVNENVRKTDEISCFISTTIAKFDDKGPLWKNNKIHWKN